MTNQTPTPLGRIPASSGSEPMYQVALYRNLILDTPYQRGSVWGPARQRNLIRSMLLGIPIGMIYLNQRPDDGLSVAVVDGKQRIETYIALVNDMVTLPASWFEGADYDATITTDDGPYVTWSCLTSRGKGKIDRCPVTTMRTDLQTIALEATLFDLVNYGGVAQGDSD